MPIKIQHRMDPRDLILYPNNLWMYLYYFGFPSYGVTVLSIAYFGQSNHFRAALIHLMKADISSSSTDNGNQSKIVMVKMEKK